MSGLPTSTAARLHRSGTCEWRTECGRFIFDGFYVRDLDIPKWILKSTNGARRHVGEAEGPGSAQELIDAYLDSLAAAVLKGAQ